MAEPRRARQGDPTVAMSEAGLSEVGLPEDEDTAPMPHPLPSEPSVVVSDVRLFGSGSFFRLWVAQVVSSLGDWIGLVAILALAARVGKSSPEAAIGVVMSARMIPGFFLASVGGVLVDRWDRKRVMVTCDIGRGLVLATLPFVNTIWGLFVASLVLEILTLLWSPAKEASVPNLVGPEQLTTANSLSLVAAYGTFPIGSLLFALLAGVAKWLGQYEIVDFLAVDQETVAIFFDVLTFFTSALLISTIALPKRPSKRSEGRIDFGSTFDDLREGWRFIGTNPIVRAVMVGLSTGLIGGGMVVPLGPTFSRRVLDAGPAGFGLLLTALGFGVAAGVVSLSAIQKRMPRERIFCAAVVLAGLCMLVGASMSSLAPAMAFVFGMGVCGGAVYVLGFTLLQQNVEDDLRGRVFATLYTLVRLCLLIALSLAPLLAGALNALSNSLFDGRVEILGLRVALPGVRLTLWLGAVIILAAGALVTLGFRSRDDASPRAALEST